MAMMSTLMSCRERCLGSAYSNGVAGHNYHFPATFTSGSLPRNCGLHRSPNAINGSAHLASSLRCGSEKGQDVPKDSEEKRMSKNRDLKLGKGREPGLREEREHRIKMSSNLDMGRQETLS